MKILFVSMVAFENNTSATIRNKGIIRGLSEIGHDIDIMTLRPDQSSISFDDTMNDISGLISKAYYIDIDSKYAKLMAKKQKSSDGISVKHEKSSILKSILRKGRNILKKIYDNISIFDAQKVNVKGVSKLDVDYDKYDIIISASDPKSSHLIVDKILRDNKPCKAKWIQYWGDPMLNDITRKSDWRDGLVKYYEKKLIQKANKIVYASPLTSNIQKVTFPELAFKMDYANQVYVNVANETKNIDMMVDNTDAISIGYFGAYKSTVRNIIPLYNVAKDGEFKLNICGSSDISLLNTDNISVHGMLPYKEAIQMEAESDILVCICNSKGTQIPGKIYYCTGYNKPIIVILDSEYKEKLRDYLETFNRFILCENSEESIKSAIEKAKEQLKYGEFKISEQLTPKFMAKRILFELED